VAEVVLRINGRGYRRPSGPVVLICLDGSDPTYSDDAIAAGLMPTWARWSKEGTATLAQAQVPTFTNPNNLSIVTGVPASAHGIAGNFFLDPIGGQEIAMGSRDLLRAPTILDAMAGAGVAVAVVTAKKKLLELLTPLGGAMLATSVESARPEEEAWVGRPAPPVYSADASLWALDLGRAAVERGAELVYVSTTDFVQHKHPPASAEARAFYAAVDRRLAALEDTGALVALTADHGMNDKTEPDGSPRVVWLSELLDREIGTGAKVTLPITDPYVRHHGALGSAAMVHLFGNDAARAQGVLQAVPGIELVLPREQAAARLLLPADRIGDLVVLGDRRTALGKRPEDHDLGAVARGLRSHGGLAEQAVPLILSRRARAPLASGPIRNADLFALALGTDER
jgi:phosphonoacetate hydrolase